MGYLKNKRVYIGGPIEHDNPEFDWRKEPKKVLRTEFGLEIFDPAEDPKQQWVPVLNEARREKDYERMHAIAKGFVKKDLCLVDRSDFLISYVPYKMPTTGTVHEIVIAENAKKPVLLVCPQGKEMASFWYFGFIDHRNIFGSFAELYAYLREVDAGNCKEDDRWWFTYGLI